MVNIDDSDGSVPSAQPASTEFSPPGDTQDAAQVRAHGEHCQIVDGRSLMPELPYSWQCLVPDCGYQAVTPTRTLEASLAKWLAHVIDWHPDLEPGPVSEEDRVGMFLGDQP